MKNRFFVLLALISMIASGCDKTDLLKEIQLNPTFEFFPPEAKSFFIEVLKKPLGTGENIRFVATFEEGRIEGGYFKVLVGDSSLVLRDDGKGADKISGDNNFSVFIKEDFEQLKNRLIQRQKIILSDNQFVAFRNRAQVSLSKKEIEKLDFSKIRFGELISFPLEFVNPFNPKLNSRKTLMITDLGVVEDPLRTFNPCTGIGNPRGSWTFGELMRQMASPNPGSIASDLEVSNFVRNWLNSWVSDQTVNSEQVPARDRIQNLIQDWEARSSVSSGGELRMEFAPFKLIAIVNRLDLRGNSGYGFSNAGEGRLVFNAINSNCSPMQFTVIFEYGVNKRSCSSIKAYAQEWVNLNSLPLGSPQFNSALENITNQFTKCGTNPTKPNQNSINQVRTNEIALDSPWELREFNLSNSGQLVTVTVKQEPAVRYNAKINNADVVRLADFINTHSSEIIGNNYTVPENVPLSSSSNTPTTEFLGGKAHVTNPPTGTPPNVHHWNGQPTAGAAFVVNDEARHVFSLNTCSGCHSGETQTRFTHINPTGFGSEATLSGFLIGINEVIDAANRPSGNPTRRTFNDLARRRNDLNNLIENTCSKSQLFELAHVLTFKPLKMTH